MDFINLDKITKIDDLLKEILKIEKINSEIRKQNHNLLKTLREKVININLNNSSKLNKIYSFNPIYDSLVVTPELVCDLRNNRYFSLVGFPFTSSSIKVEPNSVSESESTPEAYRGTVFYDLVYQIRKLTFYLFNNRDSTDNDKPAKVEYKYYKNDNLIFHLHLMDKYPLVIECGSNDESFLYYVSKDRHKTQIINHSTEDTVYLVSILELAFYREITKREFFENLEKMKKIIFPNFKNIFF
ncbi:MAG: hypothetical protein ACTSRP_15690 [Candidatus Helarchaeota archaeon]